MKTLPRSVSMQCLNRVLVVCLIALGMAMPLTALSATATRNSAFIYDQDGLLIKEIVEPGDSNLCVVTEYTYDDFGNKDSTTTRNCNGSVGEAAAPAPGSDAEFAPRTTIVTYTDLTDDTGRFPLTVENALHHKETRTYDERFGTPTKLTGPNQLDTIWEYDTFGRKVYEIRADSSWTQWAYSQPCDLTNANLMQSSYCSKMISSGVSRWTYTYYDTLNRNLLTTRINFTNNAWIDEGRIEYDAKGRAARRYLPYLQDSFATAKYTQFSYDDLDRVTMQTAPDGSITTQDYAGLTVSATNDLGQTNTVTQNSQGQNTVVTDADGKSIHYVYDPFGNLTHTIDSQGNTTVISYDPRGRKVTMDDPDMGVWTYDYNALGELIRQTDAKGQIATMQYDLLGRMINRSEADLTSIWTFDTAPHGIGKLHTATADNGYSRTHTYDIYGRPESTSTVVDNAAAPYVTSVTYDIAGRVETTTYPASPTHPGGFVIKNVYNANSVLVEVRNNSTNALYWQANDIDEMGNLTQQTYGNGVVTTQIYDPATGRIRQQLAGAGNVVQNMSYTYDTLGNLQTRVDASNNLLETFGYDNLNRINVATATSGAVSNAAIFDYDELGNIVYKSDTGSYAYNPVVTNGTTTRTLPHAVAGITGTLNGVVNPTYSYDNNGNMLSGAGRTIIWNSFNMPSQINNGTKTAAFWYSPEHERTKEIQTDGSIVIALSPRYDTGLHFEKKYMATNGVLNGSVEYEHYLYAGGIMFGKYITVNDAAGITTSTKVEYYTKDRLGSIVAITDETGTVIQRLSYDVWGKRRYPDGAADPGGALNNPDMYHGFTGHETLDEVGLIHMNGRLYDPVLARFISADFMIPDAGNLQSYNRYAYVRNNPLGYTDPGGQCEAVCWGMIIGAVIAGAETNWDPEAMVVGALIGGVSAGLGSATSAAVGNGLTGAMAGAAVGGYIGTYVATGDSDAARRSAISGAVSAGMFDWAAGKGSGSGSFGRVMAHAVAGCVGASAGGGSCREGALSAGFAEFAGPKNWGDDGAQLFAHSIIGGISAELGGGKFRNGAITGAFGYLYNCLQHQECAKKMPRDSRGGYLEQRCVGKKCFPVRLNALCGDMACVNGDYNVDWTDPNSSAYAKAMGAKVAHDAGTAALAVTLATGTGPVAQAAGAAGVTAVAVEFSLTGDPQGPAAQATGSFATWATSRFRIPEPVANRIGQMVNYIFGN